MSAARIKKRAANADLELQQDEIAEPSTKRKRTASSRAVTSENTMSIDASSLEDGSVDFSKIDAVVNAMLSSLEHLQQDKSSSNDDASDSSSEILTSLSHGILLLRTWQRGLIDQCSALETKTHEQCQAKQKREQVWASLQYEKSHLEQEIATVQNFTMPHLEAVLKQHRELAQIGNSNHEQHQLEPNNPGHRSAILKHLQSEIQQRSSLEKERDQLKQTLKLAQQKCQKQQSSLKQLPKQLAALEQATKPMQQWFSLPYIGTARSERFQLAQQLPSPLYTLFVSLQQHLDEVNAPPLDNDDDDGKDAKDQMLRVVPTIGGATGPEPKKGESSSPVQSYELQWSLGVPDVNAATSSSSKTRSVSSKRTVTIHFSISSMATGPRCIQAHVSGCPTALDQKWLLCQLFDKEGSQVGSSKAGYYAWCHYLAGIHWVTKGSTTITPTAASTRAIVQTLQRRIRANATLKYIIQSLVQQHKIPQISLPASMSPSTNNNSSSWQVVSFLEQPQAPMVDEHGTRTPAKSPVSVFDVHCKKSISRSNNLEMRARVEIDRARYPSVPPRWKLSLPQSHPQAGSLPYNATHDLLEQTVNYKLLQDSTPSCSHEKETDDSKPAAKQSDGTQGDDEAKSDDMIDSEEKGDKGESEESMLFAEWILVHQLNRLLEDWEQISSAPSNGARAVRGRDRLPLNISKR